MNPIYATWMLSNNIGDAMTVWLIEQITGQVPIYVPFEVAYPKFMVSGSILNHAVEYTSVWGAGFANQQDCTNPRAYIYAVRGPITARRVRSQSGQSVQVVGDPALLMPRFYGLPGLRKMHKVGICPHYIHQQEVRAWIGDRTDIRFLNVFDTPEQFVDDLCSCEVVYSSSLHGLILADAYGIPSQWIDGTAKLGGDGCKFWDHLVIRDYLSRENGFEKLTRYITESWEEIAEADRPRDIERLHLQQLPKDIETLYKRIADRKPPDFTRLCDELWAACPFKEEDK